MFPVYSLQGTVRFICDIDSVVGDVESVDDGGAVAKPLPGRA